MKKSSYRVKSGMRHANKHEYEPLASTVASLRRYYPNRFQGFAEKNRYSQRDCAPPADDFKSIIAPPLRDCNTFC